MTVTAPAAPASLATDGAIVELDGVEKHYGAHRALAGLSLRIEPGEFVSLLGPSGCGKTTALRALAGLEGIDAGSIRIDGQDVADTPVNKRDIGMVFQQYSLFPHMTVRQNVAFGLEMRRVPAAARREQVIDALDMVHLAEFADRYPHQLSGGQQQRVALARALVTRPRVLLLDEPLSALDAKVRVSLRDEIRRIQSDLGITTVFVTHDQEEALAVSDRIAVMNAGGIEQIGTPEELYRSPVVGVHGGLRRAVEPPPRRPARWGTCSCTGSVCRHSTPRHRTARSSPTSARRTSPSRRRASPARSSRPASWGRSDGRRSGSTTTRS